MSQCIGLSVELHLHSFLYLHTSLPPHGPTHPFCTPTQTLCNGAVERRTGQWPRQQSQSKSGDHSRRMAAIRFYLLSRRQFSAHPKSSRSRIDKSLKRMARATGNTRYRYSKIAPLDHKMADNCVSLARTNTVSSTITKPIKTWKTSNKSYSYSLLNHINKMYTHDLFYLQQEWEAWLAPVHKQICTNKSPLTQCTNY